MENKNTVVYNVYPCSSSLSVHPLSLIENASIKDFHYDEKCLQIVMVTKDLVDSLIES